MISCGTPPPAEKPRGPHWNDKAVPNPRAAERQVGGFNAADRRAYHQGLQHIVNRHLRLGSFTIAQVVDQQHARDKQRADAIAAATAGREARQQAQKEHARILEERRQYEIAHHNYCTDAGKAERAAAAAGISDRAQLQYAMAGLAANEKCEDETEHLLNEAYLLSMKAMAEHAVGGDWRSDFNQANALLVQCQTTPGLYGTKTGAHCETQEGYNIRAATQWEMDSYR